MVVCLGCSRNGGLCYYYPVTLITVSYWSAQERAIWDDDDEQTLLTPRWELTAAGDPAPSCMEGDDRGCMEV